MMTPISTMALLLLLLAMLSSTCIAQAPSTPMNLFPPPTPEQQKAIKELQNQYRKDLVEDGKLAHAFCSRPDFSKKATCDKQGIVTQEEAKATVQKQCPLCGTLYTPLADPLSKLPAVIEGVDRYNQFHTDSVSLACSGRVVVRAVFKVLEPNPFLGQNPAWKNCSNAGLVQIDETAENNPNPSNGAIRCELQLPAGPASNEVQRALKAKEGPCYVCNLCSKGGGCPFNNGTWYSDTYTTTLQGCKFPQGGEYQVHRVGINMNPKARLLLAKFEVCNGSECFNQAYEESKAKTAKKCSNGIC